MSLKQQILMAALYAAATPWGDPLYDTRRRENSKPYPAPKSLPRWDVGGHIIYAKNEKDALKYAKKRGLFKEGMRAIPAEKTDPL